MAKRNMQVHFRPAVKGVSGPGPKRFEVVRAGLLKAQPGPKARKSPTYINLIYTFDIYICLFWRFFGFFCESVFKLLNGAALKQFVVFYLFILV